MVRDSSSKLAVRFLPRSRGLEQCITHAGHNALLKLNVASGKSVASILKHLRAKWVDKSTGQTLFKGELRLYPLSTPKGSSNEGWGGKSKKLKIAQIHQELNSPSKFEILYGDETSVQPHASPEWLERRHAKQKQQQRENRRDSTGSGGQISSTGNELQTPPTRRRPDGALGADGGLAPMPVRANRRQAKQAAKAVLKKTATKANNNSQITQQAAATVVTSSPTAGGAAHTAGTALAFPLGGSVAPSPQALSLPSPPKSHTAQQQPEQPEGGGQAGVLSVSALTSQLEERSVDPCLLDESSLKFGMITHTESLQAMFNGNGNSASSSAFNAFAKNNSSHSNNKSSIGSTNFAGFHAFLANKPQQPDRGAGGLTLRTPKAKAIQSAPKYKSSSSVIEKSKGDASLQFVPFKPVAPPPPPPPQQQQTPQQHKQSRAHRPHSEPKKPSASQLLLQRQRAAMVAKEKKMRELEEKEVVHAKPMGKKAKLLRKRQQRLENKRRKKKREAAGAGAKSVTKASHGSRSPASGSGSGSGSSSGGGGSSPGSHGGSSPLSAASGSEGSLIGMLLSRADKDKKRRGSVSLLRRSPRKKPRADYKESSLAAGASSDGSPTHRRPSSAPPATGSCSTPPLRKSPRKHKPQRQLSIAEMTANAALAANSRKSVSPKQPQAQQKTQQAPQARWECPRGCGKTYSVRQVKRQGDHLQQCNGEPMPGSGQKQRRGSKNSPKSRSGSATKKAVKVDNKIHRRNSGGASSSGTPRSKKQRTDAAYRRREAKLATRQQRQHRQEEDPIDWETLIDETLSASPYDSPSRSPTSREGAGGSDGPLSPMHLHSGLVSPLRRSPRKHASSSSSSPSRSSLPPTPVSPLPLRQRAADDESCLASSPRRRSPRLVQKHKQQHRQPQRQQPQYLSPFKPYEDVHAQGAFLQVPTARGSQHGFGSGTLSPLPPSKGSPRRSPRLSPPREQRQQRRQQNGLSSPAPAAKRDCFLSPGRASPGRVGTAAKRVFYGQNRRSPSSSSRVKPRTPVPKFRPSPPPTSPQQQQQQQQQQQHRDNSEDDEDVDIDIDIDDVDIDISTVSVSISSPANKVRPSKASSSSGSKGRSNRKRSSRRRLNLDGFPCSSPEGGSGSDRSPSPSLFGHHDNNNNKSSGESATGRRHTPPCQVGGWSPDARLDHLLNTVEGNVDKYLATKF